MAVQQPTEPEVALNVRDRVRFSIAAVLGSKRITAKELALMIGMNPTHLYKRLNGKTTISVEDLAAIAGALDTPVEDFFGGAIRIGCCTHFDFDTDTSVPALTLVP